MLEIIARRRGMPAALSGKSIEFVMKINLSGY